MTRWSEVGGEPGEHALQVLAGRGCGALSRVAGMGEQGRHVLELASATEVVGDRNAVVEEPRHPVDRGDAPRPGLDELGRHAVPRRAKRFSARTVADSAAGGVSTRSRTRHWTNAARAAVSSSISSSSTPIVHGRSAPAGFHRAQLGSVLNAIRPRTPRAWPASRRRASSEAGDADACLRAGHHQRRRVRDRLVRRRRRPHAEAERVAIQRPLSGRPNG